MTNKESILNLTYTTLKEKTEEVLHLVMSLQTGETPDDHDLGLRRGILLQWYQMSIETGAPLSQREADWKYLHSQAKFPKGYDE
jgi:hypothetical protein